jgi:hypothetical protein
MNKAAILALGAALALAVPGLALADCQRPTAPAAIDGKTATMDQLKAAKEAVTAFMNASDTYQTCLIDAFKAQKAAADASKTKLDPALAKAADAQVNQNQEEKQRVGADFNAAVKAYRAAHPS